MDTLGIDQWTGIRRLGNRRLWRPFGTFPLFPLLPPLFTFPVLRPFPAYQSIGYPALRISKFDSTACKNRLFEYPLTDGVEFVDENYGRRFFLGQGESVADEFCTVADEHLDELGSGQFQEGRFRLRCACSG